MEVSLAAVGLMLCVFAAGFAGLAWAVSRLARGLPLVRYEPHAPVPWGGLDVLICIVIFLVVPLQAASLASQWIAPREAESSESAAATGSGSAPWIKGIFRAAITASLHSTATAGSPANEIDKSKGQTNGTSAFALQLLVIFAATLVSMALSIVVLLLRGARWEEIGLGLAHAPRDVALGVGGFFVMVVPVYGVTILLNLLVQPEKQHDVTTALSQSREPILILSALLTAGIAAPIVEEFFVRGVFQGWLEKLERLWKGGYETSIDVLPPPTAPQSEVELASGPLGTPLAADPYASPRSPAAPAAVTTATTEPPILWLSILASSAVFAALHITNSPVDPVPIFVLALGLGYLYERTGRLLPCIVLHACLNLTSLLMVVLA